MNDISEKKIDWREKFNREFIIERITKVEISDEKQFAYVAHPVDLKGSEAKQALLDFIQLQREEANRELLEEIFGKDNHQACAYGYRCSKCVRDIPFVDSLEKGE